MYVTILKKKQLLFFFFKLHYDYYFYYFKSSNILNIFKKHNLDTTLDGNIVIDYYYFSKYHRDRFS